MMSSFVFFFFWFSEVFTAVYPSRACLLITKNNTVVIKMAIPIEINRNYVDILLSCPAIVTISMSLQISYVFDYQFIALMARQIMGHSRICLKDTIPSRPGLLTILYPSVCIGKVALAEVSKNLLALFLNMKMLGHIMDLNISDLDVDQ